jgi:hypothetical protein
VLRAAYAELLEGLQAEESPRAPIEPDQLEQLAASTGRLLQPLAEQSAALSALAGRLRRPACVGPRADATRSLLAEVGAQAAAAGARIDRLIATLHADQRRTLEEVNALERGTPAAYQAPATGSPLLVDRIG